MPGEREAGEQERGGLGMRLPWDFMRCGSSSVLPTPSSEPLESQPRGVGRGSVSVTGHSLTVDLAVLFNWVTEMGKTNHRRT